MSTEWKEIRLGDVIEFVVDNRGKTPPTCENGLYELIEVNAISPTLKTPRYNEVRKYVDEYTFKNWFRKGHPRIGDVLVPTVGTLGAVSYMEEERGCIAQNLIALRANEKRCIGEFLYYVLRNPKVRQILLNLDIGGVQPSIKVPHLLNLKIVIPPIEQQKAITSILSYLDNKIELNNAINKNLEEMAQTLFKQWFMDFEFPNENGEPYKSSGGEFKESEMGLIPKGWTVSKLNECADILMGQSPKSKYYNTDGEGLPFHQGVSNYGSRFPSHSTYCSYPLRVAKKGSILVSVRAPVGRINIADQDIIIGRGLGAINSNTHCNSYMYYLLKVIFAVEDQHGSGTIFNSITKKELEELKIINPLTPIVNLFEKVIHKMDEEISNLCSEIDSLSQLRDTLLPKLMSGEIRVPIDQDYNNPDLPMVAETAATYQS